MDYPTPPHTHTREMPTPYEGGQSPYIWTSTVRGRETGGDDTERPTSKEDDLVREEMWNFQLRFWVKDRPRMFSVEDDNCVLSKNRDRSLEGCVE